MCHGAVDVGWNRLKTIAMATAKLLQFMPYVYWIKVWKLANKLINSAAKQVSTAQKKAKTENNLPPMNESATEFRHCEQLFARRLRESSTERFAGNVTQTLLLNASGKLFASSTNSRVRTSACIKMLILLRNISTFADLILNYQKQSAEKSRKRWISIWPLHSTSKYFCFVVSGGNLRSHSALCVCAHNSNFSGEFIFRYIITARREFRFLSCRARVLSLSLSRNFFYSRHSHLVRFCAPISRRALTIQNKMPTKPPQLFQFVSIHSKCDYSMFADK